jgi:hypothetical protein
MKTIKCTLPGQVNKIDIDLNFLHPAKEIVVVVRRASEMTNDVTIGGRCLYALSNCTAWGCVAMAPEDGLPLLQKINVARGRPVNNLIYIIYVHTAHRYFLLCIILSRVDGAQEQGTGATITATKEQQHNRF